MHVSREYGNLDMSSEGMIRIDACELLFHDAMVLLKLLISSSRVKKRLWEGRQVQIGGVVRDLEAELA